MQIKGATSDGFGVSVSSAISASSYGSAQDDNDAFGDVYMWGEIVCDNSAKATMDSSNVNPFSARADILLPKPLDSNVVLDINHVSCGVKHAALLTRQGEVFTWGEESGGRLGHGVGRHAVHPCLVESLSACSIDFVACGEFHTCAVSVAGELYTWGDGTHNAGLLGHGTDASHWIPKRVSGPLEGLQVAYVTCGTWHTALITSAGQFFTFGDGTFGVLGHGNRESVFYPREVETLMGLKTIAVACGVWHTAAVVEVIVTQSSGLSGKFFTWGDGDKYRLGHGDKEPRLKPTCVPSLIDYNFHKLACGHSLTIGLTTSGHIFTMGSTVYGQLGNPLSDGKLPCLVEDKLSTESVKDVACGSYHVAILTTRGEVYTWGKGANGRLGHGDLEDRKIPTLVENLKDRSVKSIACGSNFTAAICQHKWVSGAEQSQCSACRQAFGFTRKRHNCYNCGLVHCHSCSSRKALRAALSPNPGRPYRVCDSCFLKLSKALETSGSNERRNVSRLSGESKDRFDKAETKMTRSTLPGNLNLNKNLDTKPAKQGRRSDSLSSIPTHVDLYQAFPRPVTTSAIQSANHSRTSSPFSRKNSPPRSATPIPTMSGLTFSKTATDSLKKTNDLLGQELQKLRKQVDILTQRCELQEFEVEKSAKKAEDAIQLAADESAKSIAAKEVIKTLTAQLKDMAENLPHRAYAPDSIRPRYLNIATEPLANHHLDLRKENQRNEASNGQDIPPVIAAITDYNVEHSSKRDTPTSAKMQQFNAKEARPLQNGNNSFRSRLPTTATTQMEAEWIEQYEPGIYITLMALHDRTRELKRVRFSRRRFAEQQAETWWTENREKVYEKYNVRVSERTNSSGVPRSP
ncbi:uncharacterized protein A4U43_C04F7520 [Asparagus officinalis]|uniref:FYVE-type domain-containing protein n=1 Tax=Asparagus officinalis TaxID=4686 RepID=A0A5P1EZ22_ASPOF|nr:uncharacterized protein A4U43_C04F7520 [Asparagus officinalis]